MVDEQLPTPEDLPSAVSGQAIRERSIRQGSVMLHRWWARRPTVLARIAAYLALTEKQTPDPEFLAALGEIVPSTATISAARSHIRDSQWRWAWREQQHALDEGREVDPEIHPPEALKVLDPFAGSGTIPAEAARLGCQVYAADLNPVAYNLLKTTLDFPASYISPDSSPGTGDDNTWNGLIDELKHWAQRMDSLASARVKPLFSDGGQKEDCPPTRYFWFELSQCNHCRKTIPLQDSALLKTKGNSKQSVQITIDAGTLLPLITENSPSNSQNTRGQIICLFCKSINELNHLDLQSGFNQSTLLGAVAAKEDRHTNYLAISPKEIEQWLPWTQKNSDRLTELLNQSFASSLKLPLPNQTYKSLINKGYSTFQDLFSPRQLLVALEYVAAIRAVQDEMKHTQISPNKVEAISTYLSFFLDYLVENNCRLCSWNPQTQQVKPAFAHVSAIFQRCFVESSPFGLVEDWLERVLPAIKSSSEIPKAQDIQLNDAFQLPYTEAFFDAIITDPPYYDAIPYSELADFYWVWESCVLASTNSSPDIATTEVVEEPVDLKEQEEQSSKYQVYQQKMLVFMQEAYRVLKPGRTFCFLLTTQNRAGFEEYISLGQVAGFELLSLKRFPEQDSRNISSVKVAGEAATFLVYFRKPYLKTPSSRPVVDASTQILEAAEKGRPILFDGLARLLMDNLTQEEIEEIKPLGTRGSDIEILMEALAENDPAKLLEKHFGSHGIRLLAKDLKLDMEDGRSHLEAILASFGFSVPSPTMEKGAHQIQDQLRQLKSRILRATEKDEIQGAFLNGCSAIERLLKLSIWGWAQRVFGDDRDTQLLNILNQNNPNPIHDLKHLSFGHIANLFRELPNVIASSSEVILIEQKFYRRHIYTPKQNKMGARLDSLVSLRNKIAHDTNGFLTNATLSELGDVTASELDEAIKLIEDMVKACAIPRLAEAIQEIRDKWDRRTYRLKLDDNSEVDVRLSTSLSLGTSYLYFGGGVSARPVEPLMLLLTDAMYESS